GLLVLAFVAEGAFNRLRLPPVLVLMACGFLLGPVFKLFPAAAFLEVAPYFGALAFLLILFEGGLDLHLPEVIHRFSSGAKLASLGFSVAALLGAGVGLAFGWSLSAAVLFGLVVAPISGAVVIPLAPRLGLPQSLTTVVVLEGALADVFGVLGVSVALQFFTGGGLAGLLALGSLLAAAFSVLLAVVVGLLWPRALRALREHSYLDVLTFGVALALWGAVETLGASGALAVLAFGLTLANEREILGLLKLPGEGVVELAADATRSLHKFIGQLTFLVRTFFFVFLGVVVQLQEANWAWFAAALITMALFVLGRGGVLGHFARAGALPMEKADFRTVWMLQPRGLVNAVLAMEATHRLGGLNLLPVVSIIIVVSNILVVLGLRGRRLTNAA
ncbi:MAG: cation:proton antiporter, partial [Thermoanaerobaculum sp.]